MKSIIVIIILLASLNSMAQSKDPQQEKPQFRVYSLVLHTKNGPQLSIDTVRTMITARHRINKSKIKFEGYIVRDKIFDTCWNMMPMYYHRCKD